MQHFISYITHTEQFLEFKDALVFIVPFFIALILVWKHLFAIRQKKARLKNIHRNEKIFLCHNITKVSDQCISLIGEPYGIVMQPGRKILLSQGSGEFVVTQVTENKNKDSLEAMNVDIDAPNFDVKSFRKNLRKEGWMIALRVRE